MSDEKEVRKEITKSLSGNHLKKLEPEPEKTIFNYAMGAKHIEQLEPQDRGKKSNNKEQR